MGRGCGCGRGGKRCAIDFRCEYHCVCVILQQISHSCANCLYVFFHPSVHPKTGYSTVVTGSSLGPSRLYASILLCFTAAG